MASEKLKDMSSVLVARVGERRLGWTVTEWSRHSGLFLSLLDGTAPVWAPSGSRLTLAFDRQVEGEE